MKQKRNKKNIGVNANSFVTTTKYPYITHLRELVPPLFDDYGKQAIYCPTPIEKGEGLLLAVSAGLDDSDFDGAFFMGHHMGKTIECLHSGEEVLEIVAVHRSTGERRIGYAVDAGKAIIPALMLNRKGFNVYINLNPLVAGSDIKALVDKGIFFLPDSEHREANKEDVKCIKYFMVDINTVQVDGDDSACDVDYYFERTEAEATAWRVLRYLKNELGFTTCFMAFSGRGYNLIWKVDLPANQESEELLKKCQLALANKFNSDTVSINTNRCSRYELVRLFGSINVTNDDTQKHPWLNSSIVHAPKKMVVVDADKLKKLANEAPVDSNVIAELEDLMHGRKFASSIYFNEKAKVTQFCLALFMDSTPLYNEEHDIHAICLKADEAGKTAYVINSLAFAERLKSEYLKAGEEDADIGHFITAVNTAESLYRLRYEYQNIRKFIRACR